MSAGMVEKLIMQMTGRVLAARICFLFRKAFAADFRAKWDGRFMSFTESV